MKANESINNLKLVSDHLSKIANDPKNYNNPISQYLESISMQCARDAESLKELVYGYGDY